MNYAIWLPPYKRRRRGHVASLRTWDGEVTGADAPMAWAIGLDIEDVIAWVSKIKGGVAVKDCDGGEFNIKVWGARGL